MGSGFSSADRTPDRAQKPKRDFLLQFKSIASVCTLKAAITAIAAVNQDAGWRPPTLQMLKSVNETLEQHPSTWWSKRKNKDAATDSEINPKSTPAETVPLASLSSTTKPIEPPAAAALGTQTPLARLLSTQKLTLGSLP